MQAPGKSKNCRQHCLTALAGIKKEAHFLPFILYQIAKTNQGKKKGLCETFLSVTTTNVTKKGS